MLMGYQYIQRDVSVKTLGYYDADWLCSRLEININVINLGSTNGTSPSQVGHNIPGAQLGHCKNIF